MYFSIINVLCGAGGDASFAPQANLGVRVLCFSTQFIGVFPGHDLQWLYICVAAIWGYCSLVCSQYCMLTDTYPYCTSILWLSMSRTAYYIPLCQSAATAAVICFLNSNFFYFTEPSHTTGECILIHKYSHSHYQDN